MQLSWDPSTRLAAFRQAEHVTRAHARALVDELTRCIGIDAEPFGLLIDATDVSTTEVGWRSTWAEFFRVHRAYCVLAIFGATAIIRVVIDAFRIATSMRMKAFSTEDEARSWLRTMGISA